MSGKMYVKQIKDRMPPLSSATAQGMLPVTKSSGNYNRVLEVSYLLHRSLSAEEILRQFSIEISKVVTLDSLIFTNTSEQLDLYIGAKKRHVLDYTITLHNASLGALQLSRKQPFTEAEISTLEDYIAALVYPLHHAFIYTRAIRSSSQESLSGADSSTTLQHDSEYETGIKEEHALTGVTDDNTEAKPAEQTIDSKSGFLANMSHEIRTPLNGVMGMLELLQNTRLDAKQNDYVNTARDSAASLLTITNDILNFSNIETGNDALANIPFNLHKMVEGAAIIAIQLATAKKLDVSCSVATNVPAIAVGDPVRLHQVLVNLLSNAVKFTEQGKVDVSVKVVEDTEKNIGLRFEVKDTGIGIPHDKQNSLFDAFAQADSSTTRNFGGTGLGLSISQQLVKLMGGEIGVSSTSEKGSLFWFTTTFEKTTEQFSQPSSDMEIEPHLVKPIRQSDFYSALQQNPTAIVQDSRETAENRESFSPRFEGFRVLLVDDVVTNQAIGREILGASGIEVDLADNGQQAIDAVNTNQYDLVLMDCQMPVMDGYAATKAIRAQEQAQKSPRLPIVALTANAVRGNRETCLAAGMDDYLSKPFTRTDLEKSLACWLPHVPGITDIEKTHDAITASEKSATTSQWPRLNDSLFDNKKLAELSQLTELTGNNLKKVFDAFENDASAIVPRLIEAATEENIDDARECAHALKGASAGIAAMRLSSLCYELETQARSEQIKDLPQQVNTIKVIYESTLNELKTL